jgi:hypothetical protein
MTAKGGAVCVCVGGEREQIQTETEGLPRGDDGGHSKMNRGDRWQITDASIC